MRRTEDKRTARVTRAADIQGIMSVSQEMSSWSDKILNHLGKADRSTQKSDGGVENVGKGFGPASRKLGVIDDNSDDDRVIKTPSSRGSPLTFLFPTSKAS